jgi:cytidine deaminase
MQKNEILFSYQTYTSIEELEQQDKHLILEAQKQTEHAYAPYSKFHVAATALLDDGTIVTGTNQENASFPVGICAERSLLATIANIYPSKKIITIAISYFNHFKNINDKPAAPCGMCRQAMLEWEQRQQHTFTLLLSGQSGIVFKINSAASLLPLSFMEDLVK